jgi:hypothetical protein
MELARQHANDEVAAFEREGEVAQAAMVRMLEDASMVAADVAVGKMHAYAARKAVDTVAMEAAVTALRAMRNDTAMISLEAVAMEAAKVAVRELHDGVVARQASVEVQMYGDDAADEESPVAAMAVVAAGTTAWLLLDDEEAEAATEAQRDVELCAAAERAKAAAEAERVKAAAEEEAAAEAKRARAAEQAAHWAAEMDKALAYRRDVGRNDAARRDVDPRAKTERLAGRRDDFDHLIERCMTVRRQEAAIRAAIASIEATGFSGNDDGGALQ